MSQGNPIYNKRLSKFLPEDGCIRQGWEDAIESMPKVSMPIWGGEFWWSLGTPERFRVAIHYGYDSKEKIAKAIAVLFWKSGEGKFEVVDTLPVQSANDILEVATTFGHRFAKEDTEISRQWKESMRGLYEGINIADNELQRTYATGDWGDWETSWDCADFDADEDATFLQDVVEIWRFMEIGDSTPWDTVKAYIRFMNARNAFRSQTREAAGDTALEDRARLRNIRRICQRRNVKCAIAEEARLAPPVPILLTTTHIAESEIIPPATAYSITIATLRNGISDETLLDEWHDKMRTRMMRTEDITDLLTLAAALYEIELYRRQSQTISDHYATSRLEGCHCDSDEEDW